MHEDTPKLYSFRGILLHDIKFWFYKILKLDIDNNINIMNNVNIDNNKMQNQERIE